MLQNPKREREREIYQVFVNNRLTAVTKVRIMAIKLRNLAQDNGNLAEIRKTDYKHATKECLSMLKLLEGTENYENE